MTVLYLPLFAISTAYKAGTGDDVYWAADVVGGLVVLTQSIFVQGLRVLGQKMSDPWGADRTDLSVIHFVIFNWRMSNRVLKTRFPTHEASLEEEEELAKNCIDVGGAWEDDQTDKAESGKNDQEAPTEGKSLRILAENETWQQDSWKKD